MDTRIYKTPWDHEIKEPFIAFKNRDDELEPYVNTRAILEEVDPQKEHLITIGTIPHPRDPSEKIPLCKIFTKETLREMGRTATARLKEQKKAQGSAKNLEFNWAAGPADLDRQLGQMVKFLGEGRRVDVLLARKKGSRKAEIEESRALLIKVRAAAAGCGAKEVAKADGEAGKRMTMAFKKTGGGGGTAVKDDSGDSAASMSEGDDTGTQEPNIRFGLAKK